MKGKIAWQVGDAVRVAHSEVWLVAEGQPKSMRLPVRAIGTILALEGEQVHVRWQLDSEGFRTLTGRVPRRSLFRTPVPPPRGTLKPRKCDLFLELAHV